MTSSDLIAGLALIVSAISLYVTWRGNQRQSNLIDRESEVARISIEKDFAQAKEKKQANVSAKLVKLGKSTWKLRVFNTGPADARNVNLELSEQNEMVQLNLIKDILPLKSLEKGQSIDLMVAVYIGTKPKESITLVWDDESSATRSKTIEITL
jgi:hypothetical protein